jgi:ABC-type uncharacterized transport system substrate-binding protein
MHELLPKANRFAVMVNPANAFTTEATSKALRQVAPALGLELLFFSASTPAEIDMAFSAIAGVRADALFVAPDAFFTSRGTQFAALAARDRLPASTFSSDMVAAGLLISYGTSIADMFRQVGVYSGSILKGAKPAELPVCNRPSSNSSSICKLHVCLVSTFPRRCSRALTRLSNEDAFAAVHESGCGTKRTSRDVRSLVAIGGERT